MTLECTKSYEAARNAWRPASARKPPQQPKALSKAQALRRERDWRHRQRRENEQMVIGVASSIG